MHAPSRSFRNWSSRHQAARRRLRSVAVVFAVMSLGLIASACFRRQVHVPGVFDMRTDAKEARVVRPRVPPDATRKDAEGILQGRGVVVDGDRILIEDRMYWLVGVMPVVNGDATEEFAAALRAGGGQLRDVYVGEQYMLVDWGITFLGRLLFAPVSWVTPPYTFQASGVPIGNFAAPSARTIESSTRPDSEAFERTPSPPPEDENTPPPPPLELAPDELLDGPLNDDKEGK